MNTRHPKRQASAVSVKACICTTIGLMLCASCATPPAPDDGLVGIIYHAAAGQRGDQAQRIRKLELPAAEAALSAEAGQRDPESVAPVPAVPSYRISAGDVLAISYFSRPDGKVQEYLIGIQDVLTISLAGQETRTADVTVRPDGCISFFMVGEIRVKGQTVAQVRSEIAARMSKIMPGAEVTVILKEANALARGFLDNLRTNTDLGATRVVKVRHDGTVTFPLIGEVRAVGRTLSEVSGEIEQEYDALFRGGISVALNLNSSSAGNIAVLGEVHRPGRYAVDSPVSPFFALAMAGGAADTAKKSRAVVVNRQQDGSFAWQEVNLDLDSGRPLGPEIPLRPDGMLLVPKTGVANLNVFVDQYIRRMIPISVGYSSGNWQYNAPR